MGVEDNYRSERLVTSVKGGDGAACLARRDEVEEIHSAHGGETRLDGRPEVARKPGHERCGPQDGASFLVHLLNLLSLTHHPYR